MSHYIVELKSDPSQSFHATKAANSVDLDLSRKMVHRLEVDGDFDTEFSVGLIVGNSGSGKTTLARKIWGSDWEGDLIDPAIPIIDQFPEQMTFKQRSEALTGMGLSHVPCWVRPAATLSNGQRARAECVLRLTTDAKIVVLDEWTSVVDRTVAKIMSHAVQKYARRTKRSIVLLSCHYDVIDWLQPDWIMDCTTGKFENCRQKKTTERTSRIHRPEGIKRFLAKFCTISLSEQQPFYSRLYIWAF